MTKVQGSLESRTPQSNQKKEMTIVSRGIRAVDVRAGKQKHKCTRCKRRTYAPDTAGEMKECNDSNGHRWIKVYK